MQNQFTRYEIATQVDAWQNALETLQHNQQAITTLWQQNHYDQVIVTGCGSTHYLSLAAANTMQSTLGLPTRAVPASELILHPESVYIKDSRPLLIAVSRSAETTETVQAVRDFRARYGDDVVVITCYEGRPLNDMAKLALVAPAGQEESIAQTRSFSAMLVLVEGFTRILAGQPIDAQAITHDNAAIQSLQDFVAPYSDPDKVRQYFYLGSGPRYGLAAEAMLKMKEMSLTHAEAYHPLEFRHGPMSMVDEQTVIVGLLGKEGYQAEYDVLTEMRALGGKTLCIAPHPDADYVIRADEPTPTLVQYMPLIQWLAYSRAVQKGLNPDRPRNLESVVHLRDGSITD